MSEYQYFQFDAIDRCLTVPQRRKVEKLSSHIAVNSTSATVEYHYGDFKHNPVSVLVKYFDLFTYEANWGDQRLVFRFHQDAVDQKTLRQFSMGETLSVYQKNGAVLVDCSLCENYDNDTYFEETYYDNNSASTSPFTCLYQEIMEGDYRGLYLLWLKACEHEASPDSRVAVPVPPGLKQLNDTHRKLLRFIGLDEDIVTAAQRHSAGKTPAARLFDPEKHLAQLPPDTQLAFLKKLATENPVSVKAELRNTLSALNREAAPKQAEQKKISYRQLCDEAAQRSAKRQLKARKKETERRQFYLNRLSQLESSLWTKATEFIERKKTKDYESAVHIFQALKLLAKETDQLDAYYQRADQIVNHYPSLSGLRWRMQAAEVVTSTENNSAYMENYTQRWREDHPPEREITHILLEVEKDLWLRNESNAKNES